MPSRHATDRVSVEVLQQARQDSGLSITELARRMGWIRTTPDSSRMRKQLGLADQAAGRRPIKSVTYERAIAMLEAMGFDPVDYGL